jgi:membrane protein implicated in regulation of membrane protease activity
VDHPGVYLAIAVVALIVALWLVFQFIGFFFKLIFFALIVLVAVGLWRAWQASSAPRPRG